MKALYIIRGVSGAGKSTFADSICDVVLSADNYYYDEFGDYKFDPAKLNEVHKLCFQDTESYMQAGEGRIAVANTFTREREFKPYMELAEKYGYTVFSVIVENRHGGESIHDVPATTLDKQKNRFVISL